MMVVTQLQYELQRMRQQVKVLSEQVVVLQEQLHTSEGAECALLNLVRAACIMRVCACSFFAASLPHFDREISRQTGDNNAWARLSLSLSLARARARFLSLSLIKPLG